jgi:hypothetical protein
MENLAFRRKVEHQAMQELTGQQDMQNTDGLLKEYSQVVPMALISMVLIFQVISL